MSDASLLDEIIGRVEGLSPPDRKKLLKDVFEATGDMIWVPNPGPQTRAFESLADELYYGGQAGGGKSDLGIGLGLTRHTYSLILRRFNDDAKVLAERTMTITGSRQGYNGQEQRLRQSNRQIDFGGCKDEGDKQRYKGDPHDLIVFDEIPDFLESQYTFICGWNRSTNPKQHCRVVCTGNPPTTPEGLWVLRRWAAWLDPNHHKPAKDGELRWYTTIGNKDTEVDGPGPHMIKNEVTGVEEPIIAKSRTFIRAKLVDNPDLSATNYDSVLASMPEELRAAYRDGRFDAGLKDQARQIIPSAWIREAQERWTEKPPVGVPMCTIAADCTGGGRDPLTIGWRHDGWFSRLEQIQGKDMPQAMLGRTTAGHVIAYRRDRATIVIDMGGGYGNAAYEHLATNIDDGTASGLLPMLVGFKGSEGTTSRTIPDKMLGFKNRRTMALWRLREALDPGQLGGSPIMLPDDPEMVADLTAVTFTVVGSTIVAESKEDVCARLGRSTDKGDTVCMCWSAGATASTDGAIWEKQQKEMRHPLGRRPQVIKPTRNSRR